jgi:hypothetical protein
MVLAFLAADAAGSPSMTAAASSMIAVLGLVALNAFFVASEFSLVAARRRATARPAPFRRHSNT